jgi:CubicO group peptidase (beta-lactamase class C family)
MLGSAQRFGGFRMSLYRGCCSALVSAATLLFWNVAAAQPPVDAAAIDTIFARFDKPTVPGCALGLYRDGRIVYERGYGSANLDHGVAITPDTVFYIGSTAKQFTAFAAALLIEQGKVSLSDPVRKYFPELPAWADPITVDHLIHHTSGIRDYLALWEMSGRSFAGAIGLEEAITLIARQRATNFAPGAQWSYSNSNYVLLAELVGRTAGTSIRQFAESAMFAPLGMTSTHFHDDNTMIVPHRAVGYSPAGPERFRIVATTYALVGDGGLLTTVRDLVKWDENFYDNKLGGGAALIEKITTPGKLANGAAHQYAFGLTPGTYRGLAVVQHGGSFIGFRAQLLRFPTEHVSVAVLCNDASANAEGLAQQVADSYLASRLAAPPAPPARPPGPTAPTSSAAPVAIAPAELQRFVGRYELPTGIVSIVEVDGALRIRLRGREQPMVPTSATTFSGGLAGDIEFVVDGENVSLWMKATPSPPAPRLAEPDLSPQALAQYVGRYASTELDTWYTFRAVENGLEIRARYSPWGRLQPVAPDRFLAGPSELRFERDGNSQITGFVMTSERAANIWVERAADTAAP